ncbi:hypothetical protein RND81_01G196200 [Saponaria officinalis]|uniref:C2 domain-containing protein n=1 Tax=Saponaria officinalis TaxID=3572 RepID=A0AAW1NJU3_SAPOF
MHEGVLQVLLVRAKGLRHTHSSHLFGKPLYYAVLQCGTKERKSKTTKGYEHEAIWNQEIEFEFPISEWKKLRHLKIRIMDENYFSNGGFVGQAIIFVGGIVEEGNDKGYIELHPSLYNVVLEDTTYKGEIKIGFKFSVNKDVRDKEGEEGSMQIIGTNWNLYKSFWRFLRFSSWWRFLFPYNKY